MSEVHRLLAELLYGTGMRISEALGLRVKDVDFGHRAIYVREGKGGKDRIAMPPQSLLASIRVQLGLYPPSLASRCRRGPCRR